LCAGKSPRAPSRRWRRPGAEERLDVGAEIGDQKRRLVRAIKPEMKCTSRESRSSLATAKAQAFPLPRVPASAAANCGRRSSASAPLPVFALPSTNCDGGHSERCVKMVKFS
jgi:hypothetical protein